MDRAAGAPGNSGQTSRTRSQRVITWSKRWPANSSGAWSGARRCRCRARASPARRWDAAAWDGCPRWRALTAPPDSCSSSASAICERALLPVHRNSTRATRGRVGPRRRAAAAAQARVQRGAGARRAARRSARGRARSRCRGRRRSCGASRPGRRRAAGAGGTRPGSGAGPPARTARRRADRCAPARSAAASAADGPPAAGTAAASARRSRRGDHAAENTSIQFDALPRISPAPGASKAYRSPQPRRTGCPPPDTRGAPRSSPLPRASR